MEIDSMTQTELASYLETLTKLVEATAKDPQPALSGTQSKRLSSPQPSTAQGA